MQEQETGAWRGRIEDGELVEDHPADNDEGRESRAELVARGRSGRGRGALEVFGSRARVRG
jgi:hypothetical protein